MPAKNLSSYLREKDKYGVGVGSWAISDKLVMQNVDTVDQVTILRKVLAHYLATVTTKKHREKMPNSNMAQLTLEESLSDSLSTKTAQAEKAKR